MKRRNIEIDTEMSEKNFGMKTRKKLQIPWIYLPKIFKMEKNVFQKLLIKVIIVIFINNFHSW